MKKIWYNWSKPKKIISIVCICLCCVLLAGCVVNLFADDKADSENIGDKIAGAVGISKTRNPLNMLDPEYYSDKIEGRQNGVKVTVNDDGSITLDGEVEEFIELELIKVVYTNYDVEADYVNTAFTVGPVDFGSEADKSCLSIVPDNSELGYTKLSPKSTATFGLPECDVSLCIMLYEGDEFDNVTIYPTLNPGFVACPFYEETNVLSNIFKKERNSNNLFDPEYYDSIEGEHNGVDVTVNNDGSITLDGKATGSFSLTLVELSAEFFYNTYLTFSGFDFGNDAPGTELIYSVPDEFMSLIYNGFSSTIFVDSLISGSSCNLEINVKSGDEFDNVTIYPMLNYGITAEPYFK